MDIAETAAKPFAPGHGFVEIEDPSRRKRSAVTNGSKAFAGAGSGNSPWYRRFKDIAELHASDLGGQETLSEAQLSLCRRASTMEVELERMEGQLSLGQEVDLEVYSRISGNLRRILESLGLRRVARDVTAPDLRTYLKAKAAP